MREPVLKKLERIRRGSRPRVLDLFAGAGGLSLGFHTAGLEITGAVEIESKAARTHALNFFHDHPEEIIELHALERDLTRIGPEELLGELGSVSPLGEAVDAIIGGPPCQAFARVGRAKLREVAEHPEAFLQDPRSNLYLYFLHYVRVLQPLVILMENVPDALNYGGHNIAEETCEVLTAEMGYRCAYTLLNSAFYGVPQMRERMFLLAYAPELELDTVAFPAPTHWIELPQGYEGTRSVALNGLRGNGKQLQLFEETCYLPSPRPSKDLPVAVSAKEALSDLPPIFARELLKEGRIRRGVQDPMEEEAYATGSPQSSYSQLMRRWRGFETGPMFTGHIIRYLPRDYKLFARMKHGDQYPELHRLARAMFREEYQRRHSAGESLPDNLQQVRELWREFVPPYDPYKFPNKWRKMEPDMPARTLMAHIGKDTYSHIHYDSEQARTISVREAARLQSFPDGFLFAGKMNAAFRQIGNAVPPLLAYHIASEIMRALGQEPQPILSESNPTKDEAEAYLKRITTKFVLGVKIR